MSEIFRRAACAGLAAAAILVVAATPAVAQSPPKPTDEQRAAALARPAVVFLQMTYSGYVFDETETLFNDSEPYEFTASCTGFVVNPAGYIATAGHCVDVGPEGARGTLIDFAVADILAADPTVPADEQTEFALLNYRTEGFNEGSPIDRKVEVITGAGTGNSLEGEVLTAEVIDFQTFSEGDVALLKIPATALPSIELAPDADVSQGTPVLSIGYPGNRQAVIDRTLEPTFKDGQISSRTTTGSVPVYEVSAAVSPGMSGGPTVGLDGRVVGVNSFGAGRTEAFNFIATATRLNELLGRNNVKAELGRVDLAYREGLKLFFDGRYSDSIAQFDEVLGMSPNFRQAQEYKTNAVRARAELGDPGTNPLWFFVGGGILALVAAVVLVVVVVRRSGGRKAAPAYSGAGFPPGVPAGYPVPSLGPGPPGQGYGPAAPASVGSPERTAGAPEQFGGPMSKACPRCGTSQASQARFCSNCGNTLA